MARSRIPKSDIRKARRRTTWTRFYLPQGQDWPKWSTGSPDLGPLAEVKGYVNVWHAREVDDPEKAAIIILWDSADTLKSFLDSPACAEFLEGLPESDTVSSEILQRLSLSDENGGSKLIPSPTSRFPSIHWFGRDRFEENLKGRVTLTALLLPYKGVSESDREQLRRSVHQVFEDFMPADCDDLRPPPPLKRTDPFPDGKWPGLVAFVPKPSGWVWAWTDTGDKDLWQPGEESEREETDSGQMILYMFRNWNGYCGANAAREEASAKNSRAKESWAQVVAKAMPPVTAWEQERWNIQEAPSLVPPDNRTQEEIDQEAADEAEEDRLREEMFEQHRRIRNEQDGKQ